METRTKPHSSEAAEVAKALRAGMAADIWFDASEYEDEELSEQIEKAQQAMARAADLLDGII